MIAPSAAAGPAEVIAAVVTILAVRRLPLVALVAVAMAVVVVGRRVFGG